MGIATFVNTCEESEVIKTYSVQVIYEIDIELSIHNVAYANLKFSICVEAKSADDALKKASIIAIDSFNLQQKSEFTIIEICIKEAE